VLRWGIAATGGIARTVGRVIAAEPDMMVTAVGSRDAGRARTLAADLGAMHAYGSYAELVRCPDIDVVYIATPQSHHLEVAELAIAAGRPVLCEKPLAATLADAEKMVTLAREAGVFLMEAMWMRFNPLVRHLRELVVSGELGRLRTVSASFGLPVPERDHRLWNPALGGGALLDLGVYPLGLACWLLGEPEVMTVTGAMENGVDAEAGILLSYRDGARALLDTSLISPLANTAQVTGTRMRADLDGPFFATERMVLTTADGERREHVLEPGETGYVGEIREVRDRLAEGATESPVMPLDDSLAMMRLLEDARLRVTDPTGARA
jgi:Predicted dehydrogenases and related proteins